MGAGAGVTGADSSIRSQRRVDRWKGRRDGRRRQPMFNDVVGLHEKGRAATAQHPNHLLEQQLHEVEGEYRAWVARIADRLRRLAALEQNRASANSAQTRLAAAVVAAGAAITVEELMPRNPIELTVLEAGVIRGRREDMRAQRIATARMNEAAGFTTLQQLDSEIATVKAEMSGEFVLAQTAARQAGARYAARVETYWENVVHVHPEGPHLAPILRFTSQLMPDWVTAPPVHEPAGLAPDLFVPRGIVRRLARVDES
ncbi:hypothetical protein [Kutzneria sp. NPDC051319]|uniref:hypothetical protein n=1 Tax=Kutzneria sp. NPDC051319 TaxID=3155047 RepID=UPI0034405023